MVVETDGAVQFRPFSAACIVVETVLPNNVQHSVHSCRQAPPQKLSPPVRARTGGIGLEMETAVLRARIFPVAGVIGHARTTTRAECPRLAPASRRRSEGQSSRETDRYSGMARANCAPIITYCSEAASRKKQECRSLLLFGLAPVELPAPPCSRRGESPIWSAMGDTELGMIGLQFADRWTLPWGARNGHTGLFGGFAVFGFVACFSHAALQ